MILEAAAIASATDGRPDAFEEALTSRVRTSALSSVVLLRHVDDQFSTLSEVGRRQPFLSDEINHSLRDRLAEIVAGGGLRLVELASVEEGRLVALATPAGESDFVVYAELLLPDVLVGAPTSVTPGVLYALYFGEESARAAAAAAAKIQRQRPLIRSPHLLKSQLRHPASRRQGHPSPRQQARMGSKPGSGR